MAAKRSATVNVRIDAALKKRWNMRLATLERAKRNGASDLDALWESVAEIVEADPPLYLAGGVASDAEFFRRYLGEDQRTARRMMRIAKFCSPNDIEHYGTSELDAVLEYLQTSAGGVPLKRLPVALDRVLIPVKRGGHDTNTHLATATVEEVRAATRALKKHAPSKKSPLAAALAKALKGRALRGVTVHVGRDSLSLTHVPIAALKDLARALGSVKTP